MLRRFDGEDIDVHAPIPSDVVCAAAVADPAIWPAARPYLAMRALPLDVRVGFYGKLPSRGDFLRESLPRDFVEAWDAWWQRGLVATQQRPQEEFSDVLGTIAVPRDIISVAFGGPYKKTLYAVAIRDVQIFTIPLIAQGYRGRPK